MKTKQVSQSFWKNKRVFLTGHTGFKGSWLSEWLCQMGAHVHGYALAPDKAGVPDTYAPLFEEAGLADRMKHMVGDVRDSDTLKSALTAFAPEIVIHMAAQPLVRLSYREPVETYATNVMGTVNLLDACRSLMSLKAVLIVTSDKCYENREQIWGYREGDAMGGHDPYSNSKGCAELVTAAYRNSYFDSVGTNENPVAVISGRAGNVIGGGDWSEDRLIPDAMRAYVAGQSLEIRNPYAVRPWQHVLEPLSGYLTAIEASYENQTLAAQGWNFGPVDDMNLTVGDVIDQMSAAIGDKFSWQTDADPNQPHEANLLRLDCTAARELLGWVPRFSCEEMLSMTIDWYTAANASERHKVMINHLDRMNEEVRGA